MWEFISENMTNSCQNVERIGSQYPLLIVKGEDRGKLALGKWSLGFAFWLLLDSQI